MPPIMGSADCPAHDHKNFDEVVVGKGVYVKGKDGTTLCLYAGHGDTGSPYVAFIPSDGASATLGLMLASGVPTMQIVKDGQVHMLDLTKLIGLLK